MKNQTNTNPLVRTSLALAFAISALLPISASAEDKPVMPMKDGKHQMMQSCQAMMEQKEKMMAEMKVQDTEMTAQVATMNSAPEDKKSDLMADIVTKMVEQRSAMHVSMGTMQGGMMQHMMQHMKMGNDSMATCPMMKGMMTMDEKSADAHKGHHHKD